MRKFIVLLVIVLSVFTIAALSGCEFLLGSEEYVPNIDVDYVIQYATDSEVKSISVTSGKSYSIEELPQKQGYTFGGLYDAESGGTQYIGPTGLSIAPWGEMTDKTLYIRWNPKSYKVTFDYNGGEQEPVVLSFAYDSEISGIPTDATKEGYDFIGWFSEKETGGEQYGNSSGVLATKITFNEKNYPLEKDNIILYARYSIREYSVSFNYNDGSKRETTVKIPHGSHYRLYEPADTTKDEEEPYLTVAHWSLSKAANTEYMEKITSDVTLYAKWSTAVVFDEIGGSSVADIAATAESEINKLPETTKIGHTFKGWKQSNEESVSVPFTMPENGIKLSAVWEINYYTVSFNANGGKCSPSSSKVAYGGKIDYPKPTRSFYTFAGWASAPKNMGAEDITVTAQWELISSRSYTNYGGTVDHKMGESYAVGINLNNQFDMNAIKSNYNSLKISVSFYAKEEEHGYQEFYISTAGCIDTGGVLSDDSRLVFDDCVSPRKGAASGATASPSSDASWTAIETAGTKKGEGWHTFVLWTGSNRFDTTNQIVFTWGAHGSLGDKWTVSNISMVLEFY